MSNGVIVLTSGRPTIGLWVCTDGRGESWDLVNLAKVHNQLYPPCGGKAVLSNAEVASCLGWPESNVNCKDWDCVAPEPMTNAYSRCETTHSVTLRRLCSDMRSLLCG